MKEKAKEKHNVTEALLLRLCSFGYKILLLGEGTIVGLQKHISNTASRNDSENRKKRIITGFFIAVFGTIIICAGGSIFATTIVFLASIAMTEIYAMTEKLAPKDVKVAIRLGTFWVFTTFGSIIGIRFMRQGFVITTWLFLTIAVLDSAAYFIGKTFGKRKLFPTISPGKTVEGAIGGSVAAMVISLMFYSIFGDRIGSLSFIIFILLTIYVIIFAQIGDAVQSKIKRYCCIKDTGYIIVGHGGIMDRMDSFMIVAPSLYIIGILFRGILF